MSDRPATLRPATADDAPAMARILWDCFEISLPFLPQLHTREGHLGFFREMLLPQFTVWVAEADDGVCGYVAFSSDHVRHLYVHPDAQGRGVGPALLAKAMEDGLAKDLWTFQQNTRARGFYESHGFVAVEFTQGEGNDEKMPDVRYQWTP
jgi:ribosomal protein S18 acetylase RimI-like enzyme